MFELLVLLFASIGLVTIVNEALKATHVYEMSIFKRYWNYLNTWREHRETIKQLNRLTDAELSDIGISRSDIDRLVWLGEDKTMRGRGEKE